MHYFSPMYYPPAFPGFMIAFLPLLAAAILWTIILKGYSLWYAARGSQKWWFIALLIINTLGILEIVYLIWFRPKSSSIAKESTPVHHSSEPA